MKALVQRVLSGKVTNDGEITGQINKGFVVLLGIGKTDTEEDIDYLVNKTINLRVFDDDDGKMNLSLLDTHGEMLIVSQFTLLADTRCGRRPSFIDAAAPDIAEKMYQSFIQKVKNYGVPVATGRFQTEMVVSIENHGPVTIIIDSADRLKSRNK